MTSYSDTSECRNCIIGCQVIWLSYLFVLLICSCISPFRYLVEQRILPSIHWKRYQSNIEDTKLDIKSYDVKKDYMYRVIAFNEFGRSDPSNSLFVYAKTRKLTMSRNSISTWRNPQPFAILNQVRFTPDQLLVVFYFEKITFKKYNCLTSLTRAKCGVRSTLCWKIPNISGSI